VISYELGARVQESVLGASLWDRGWTSDVRGGLNMPPALGKIMALTEEQIANAIGICTSHSLPLGILDTHREENTMTKNLRFGFVAYNAILSCFLAKRGFTGPVRIVEGESGYRQVILQGDMDLERMTDFSGWRILKTRHKCLCINVTTIGHVLATLEIVKEHDLKPEDIATVRIKTCFRDYLHTTTPAKKYPRNAESADHSAFYANAIAIKEKTFGPESFKPEKFNDPVILDLIEKITVEPDSSMPVYSYRGISEIITKDGCRYSKSMDLPHGLGDDPLTDGELEDKFKEMALKYMSREKIQKIVDMVWNVDGIDDIGELTKQMVMV
jgi:2-methylcitrate dehydratase